jgi:hypothetical protein
MRLMLVVCEVWLKPQAAVLLDLLTTLPKPQTALVWL